MDTSVRPRADALWRLPSTRLLRHQDRVTRTGSLCPTSGAWTCEAWPCAAVVVLEGEVMPALEGEAVEWHYSITLNPILTLELG